MSETSTPETDAEAIDGIDCYGDSLKSWDYKASKDGEVVPAEFARRLERERDEARGELDELRKKLYDSDAVMKWSASKVEELNEGLIRLVKERDEARRKREELKRAAMEVLKIVPAAHCSDMHHGKRDMHSALEPCPVVDRYNSKIDKLRALLEEEA